jgi:hypothetical protein
MPAICWDIEHAVKGCPVLFKEAMKWSNDLNTSTFPHLETNRVQVKINTLCEHVPLRTETSQSDNVWNQQILIDRARTCTWHCTLWLNWNMPLDLRSCTAWQNVLLSKELKRYRITHWCVLCGFILAYRQNTLQLDVKIKRWSWSWSWWRQQLWLLLRNFI